MIDLRRIRYVRIGTPDLGEATNFATKILGLEPAGRERGIAYFRSDDRDHTIAYVEGDPGQHADGVRGFGERRPCGRSRPSSNAPAIRCTLGRRPNREVRRVLDFISFADPTGNTMEIVWRPQIGNAALLSLTRRGHHGFQSHRLAHDRRPARRSVLDRVSSTRGSATGSAPRPLLRINEVHHTLALFPSTTQACSTSTTRSSRSTTSCARGTSCANSAGCGWCSGRAAISRRVRCSCTSKASTAWSTSIRAACMIIDDESIYIPRQLPFTAEAFCMWGAKPDIVEFRASRSARYRLGGRR